MDFAYELMFLKESPKRKRGRPPMNAAGTAAAADVNSSLKKPLKEGDSFSQKPRKDVKIASKRILQETNSSQKRFVSL